MSIASTFKTFERLLASVGLALRSIFRSTHPGIVDNKINNHVVRAFSQGNAPAFKHIFDHYAPAVYKVLCRYLRSKHLAEEVTANVFSSLWLNRSQFSEAEEVRLYLFTMTRKMAISCLNKLVKSDQKPAAYRDGTDIKYEYITKSGNTPYPYSQYPIAKRIGQ